MIFTEFQFTPYSLNVKYIDNILYVYLGQLTLY